MKSDRSHPVGATVSGKAVWTPLLAAALAAGVTPGFEARGEGFRDPTSSAFELGRAGGRIAQGDDASTVSSNPANLADVTTPEFEFAPEAVYFRVKYDTPGGQEISTSNPWKFLPDVYGSIPIPGTPLTFGVGITSPFGLSNEWPVANPLFPSYASLWVINANPSLAWKINDRLKIGAGLDIFDSELDLRFNAAPGLPVQYWGAGTGYGGNAGVTWEPFDGHRLALTYRSPVGVDYAGSFSGLPSGNSSFNSAITYPTIVSAGYGVQVTKTIRLETDIEWIQFSRFSSLPLASPGAAAVGLPPSVAENWRNTFTFGFAGDWNFAPGWMLRGGYQFYQTPVPASTFSPAIPDANQNALTIGIGYKAKHHGLELAYAAILYNERDIATGPFPGKYQVSAHLISLSYRYSF